jgi:hypothetical protein
MGKKGYNREETGKYVTARTGMCPENKPPRNYSRARCPWLRPVILATQEDHYLKPAQANSS